MADFLKNSPLYISTTIKHYLNGPPRPSWNLTSHIFWAKFISLLVSNKTIEEMQRASFSFQPSPVQAGVVINEFKIDNKYRNEAQVHLDKILKPYEHVLDPEWKNLKDDGIISEWLQVPNDGWEKRENKKTILYIHGGAYYFFTKETYRCITSPLAKIANARVLAFNYRLAPQNQFPAALHDALAAYLYLLNPPKDAGFEPLNPKNIVICGDSAGGGLSLALGLAIRDAGLPSCAGIIGLCCGTLQSPWVDLTASLPSILDDGCADYIPNVTGGAASFYAESQASKEYKGKDAALAAKIKNQNLGPKIWHDSFDRPEGRLQLYVNNEGLAIPYVSPMLAESLGNLPPLLLVAGDEERLRDETIYFAYRSAEPTKYKGPSYNAGKFEKSQFQTPTNTTFEIYEEMPHVFQFVDYACTTKSYERMSEFINRVTNILNEPLPPSSFNYINIKGELNPLNERHKKVLNWEKIGIVPNSAALSELK
ncbi:Alpha/Beta hydrolase protein [Rhizophagus irregularis DAOM 181602=DAOM 197198]|uniref:Alpha/Beta hydrolase protein n=1 Tax=Rhizophagus irregularis (strain DAOM 181602 / DAOM 197198 / MUCL 43194) TaxID=747089 RepID=A0A2P4PDI4_RHIID|nr:Alpha/Beta hydrolase protein [Rhizophagus irregularis DAOM 181602=DAOM 197198]POG63440.1 Alpha/Beta hydrolase protein [Rhizophagus irregularis DAOM 181602=DAOM 197198]|eukprot:XP_025170306.1 Alpha/Beta hydrolase protein [Rhizophagus irregularis DAOM 181602=DAOM 197198]